MDMQKYFAQQWFVYTASLSSLAAATSQSDQINMESDSDFLINKITYSVFDAADGAIVTNPNLTVQLTDSASGRNLFDEAIPIANFAGSGELPGIPPVAYLLRAKSTFTVTFSNRDNTTLYNIALSFLGTKLFLK